MTSHDFVVVGAGTAGCVLASRLAQSAEATVLLLEAGGREPLDAAAEPALWPSLQGTSMDWAGRSVAQAATGTAVAWSRGRGLGGSSAINGMCHLRGHRSSYDVWVESGLTGWGFTDLVPYLKRSENAEGRDPAVRGLGGPLTVRPAVHPHPLSEAAFGAAEETGVPCVSDINSGLDEGFGWADLNIVDGRRQSAADAYLRPVRGLPNLDVVTDALVHRVRLGNGRATGVDYSVGDVLFTADCRSEVVLAAGTVGSAQLLLLSGIGPQSHLREVGVEVLLDLPGVGENLHDHPRSTVVYNATRRVAPGLNNHAETVGLVRSGATLDAPDIQFQVVDIPYHAPALPPRLSVPGRGFTIAFCAATPRSRGSVRLASTEPGAMPRLDPNYYGDSRDVEVMTAALRIARAMGRAPAFDPWRGEEALPGPAVHDDDHGSVRDYLYRSLRTYFHHVGTCRMGADDSAVVDGDLRVRGIDGLRVADASVMPSVVSANTNATVCGIAERAADLLLRR
ncbi:GMC family oxidoreductase N-terminal domain-containing protein [Streptomyces sp. NPDC005731]|uniref:GMC family oxidoreductase n=1 Tax=Streptomyces sp. NPDC005731 TaxID=3157056 RepID=UPI0033FCD4BC